ncbi:hypothetical protein ACTG9Q_32540 [Actinokineospora sp. 24-640]
MLVEAGPGTLVGGHRLVLAHPVRITWWFSGYFRADNVEGRRGLAGVVDGDRRNVGGAPPKIRRDDLLARYGPPGVRLAEFMVRLRTEGRFHNKNAAALWIIQDRQRPPAERDPAARALLAQPTTKTPPTGVQDPEIKPRVLSELMHMKDQRVPVGLVHAFFDLWARKTGVSPVDAAVVRRDLDEIYDSVPAKPRARGQSHNAREITSLKNQLIATQQQLIDAVGNRERYVKLVSAYDVVLRELAQQHVRLVRERDDLRHRLDTAEALAHTGHEDRDPAAHRVRAAEEQLARAEAGQADTEQRLAEATALADELRRQRDELQIRLIRYENTSPASVESSPYLPALPGGRSDSLEEHRRVLDRLDEVRHEGEQQLEQTRRAVHQHPETAPAEPPDEPSPTVIDSATHAPRPPVILLDDGQPDNSLSSKNVPVRRWRSTPPPRRPQPPGERGRKNRTVARGTSPSRAPLSMIGILGRAFGGVVGAAFGMLGAENLVKPIFGHAPGFFPYLITITAFVAAIGFIVTTVKTTFSLFIAWFVHFSVSMAGYGIGVEFANSGPLGDFDKHPYVASYPDCGPNACVGGVGYKIPAAMTITFTTDMTPNKFDSVLIADEQCGNGSFEVPWWIKVNGSIWNEGWFSDVVDRAGLPTLAWSTPTTIEIYIAARREANCTVYWVGR